MKVTNTCEFDFSHFPFDSHVCEWDLGDAQFEVSGVVFEKAEASYLNKETTKADFVKITRPRLSFDIDLESKEPFVHVIATLNESYSYTGLR